MERQDPPSPEARKSTTDHHSERSAKYEETRRSRHEETRRGNVDHRIQGIPHSTVQKEDSNRKEIAKRLIQQFDTHPNRDSLTEDLKKTGEFNQRKVEGVDQQHGQHGVVRAVRGLFSTIQCPDCSFYWDAGIGYCTCGGCLQPSEGNRQLNKDRYDVLSIPGVIKKNPTHGARHGPIVRQESLPQSTQHAQESPEETVQTLSTKVLCLQGGMKKLSWPTTRSHWRLLHCDERGKKSERELMETLIERRRCTSGPLERSDWKEAKETCVRHHEHTAIAGSGNTPTPPQQQVRQRPNQQFEGHEECSYRLDIWMDILCSRDTAFVFSLRHHGGNRAGGQRGTGTLHHGVNSDFFSIVPNETFRLPKI